MPTLSSPDVKNYLQDHIRDAIETNKFLRSKYADLSSGRSEKIFRFLINAEKMALPLALPFDRRSHAFQEKGIALFQNEFLPMNPVSPILRNPPANERVKIDWMRTWKRLRDFHNSDDWEGFLKECLSQINELQRAPEFSIMVRHILESVYRCGYLLREHRRESELKEVESPVTLVKDLIAFQLWGLPGMAMIDNWCEPLQKEGIPLFQNELPDLLRDLSPSDS